ncbi:MAG TPA: hypothetical protein VN821_04375, partial [Candidatus Udaeobacter sp.]|nr:hypothetical protein [Candidatus Udaeobacter sp.]
MTIPRLSLSLAVLAGLSLFGAAGCVFEGRSHGYGGYNGGNDNAYNSSYHDSHMPNDSGSYEGNGQYKWYQSNSGGNYAGNGH